MKQLCFILWFVCGAIFSQEIISEEVLLKNGDIELPGTLSYPDLSKSVPLVIFVHGSGNGDRDGNQGNLAKADHIKILADSLNTKGIAFYRYDKRSSNFNNFKYLKKTRFVDLADDVKTAIDFFSKNKRFNSIHLIGHSQGSLVAMLATTKSVTTYTSLAGPGTSIGTTLVTQISAQNEDLGKAAELHIKELLETDTIQEVNLFLISIFNPDTQPFLKEWLLYDPSHEIKKLNIPTLIINGTADSQVTEQDANLLFEAKPNAKLVIIEKMNHLLKMVENTAENQKSYTDPNFPISVELIKEVAEFIKANE